MFKTIATLLRGRTEDAVENFADANALPLLRQQIRESGQAVALSRRAVATAMAAHKQEDERYERLVAQIADLETRAIAAMEKEDGDMAREAAEAIAHLENEKTSSQKARDRRLPRARPRLFILVKIPRGLGQRPSKNIECASAHL